MTMSEEELIQIFLIMDGAVCGWLVGLSLAESQGKPVYILCRGAETPYFKTKARHVAWWI